MAEAMNARYDAPTESAPEWADAIVLGSPSRFDATAAELKAFINGLARFGSKVG